MSVDPLVFWRESLAEWAIPEAILSRAPESPWTLPSDLFARRADLQIKRRGGLSLRRAEEALAPRGTVLDVGAGAGAASLPLAALTSELVAVDGDPAMLAELRKRADALELPVTTVEGAWPGAADRTSVCDVAICSHVLYNVPDLGPFLEALDSHANRRVVIEITASHPVGALNPLWLRFHDLRRPERPTWEDAAAAIRAIGLSPTIEHETTGEGNPSAATYEALVAWTRRRLCLDASRDQEVSDALVDLGMVPDQPETWSLRPRELAILWWDRR